MSSREELMDVPQMIARAQYWHSWCIDHEIHDPELERLRYLLNSVIGHLQNERDAVFEKAHTLTDDEREALETAIWEVLESRLEDVIDLDLNAPADNAVFAILVGQVADSVAGFCRSDPSTQRIGCNICGESLPDGEPHLCSEPQAEPTDAQVRAAWRCPRCGSRRWVGYGMWPGSGPVKAQCVPCGAVSDWPTVEQGGSK